MKIRLTALKSAPFLLLLAILVPQFSALAQSPDFTYQGHLTDGGGPANGANYSMVFNLYDAPTNGNNLASMAATNVPVSNGVFSIDLDFNANFSGADYWIEIAVQKNGGAFTTLTPRQKITATPYAITAANLSGALPAAQLSGNLPATQLSGTLPDGSIAGIYTSAVTLNNASNSFWGAFAGDASGLTNIDQGTTSVDDFPSMTDALLQWTNRGGRLYLANGAYDQFVPFNFAGMADTTPDSFAGLTVKGNSFGASRWRWLGTNQTMLSYNTGITPVNFEDLELLDVGTGGNNSGYVQTSITNGGVGPIFWKNVLLNNWNLGAIIRNSVGFFYGLNLNNCGIGMYFPFLSDGQVIDVRSIGQTNAALVFDSKGARIYYNAAGDQIGVLIGNGGGNLIQASAEVVSNCVVAIGYPPPSVFPTQGLPIPGSSSIAGNHIGWGYMMSGASNAHSAGLPALAKLWFPSMALQVEDEEIITGLGVVSETNIADLTPMTFDGVYSATNIVTFSDGSSIGPAVPGTHLGVNVADSEYNLARLVYRRDTNGVVLDSQTIGAHLNTTNTTSYAVNLGVRYQSVTVNGNLNVSVAGTNLLTQTNGLSVDFVLTSTAARTLTFPANWKWENASGNAVAPTTLAANSFLHVQLTVMNAIYFARFFISH